MRLLPKCLVLAVMGLQIVVFPPFALIASAKDPAGVAVTIAVAVAQEVIEAIKSLGTAVSYAKVRIDGPDADDRAVGYDFDRDRGLDWYLDADTGAVIAKNGLGEDHLGWAEIHFYCTSTASVSNATDYRVSSLRMLKIITYRYPARCRRKGGRASPLPGGPPGCLRPPVPCIPRDPGSRGPGNRG